MNYDELYQLRIRQWAWNGTAPYCNWFTREELEKFFATRRKV